MGSIVGWLVGKTLFGRTITEPFARIIATAGLFLFVLGTLYAAKVAYDSNVIAVHNQKIAARAAPATDRASSERGQDKIAETKHAEELHNAIHSVPDAPPSGPSHALACKRLHDLGRDPPACR